MSNDRKKQEGLFMENTKAYEEYVKCTYEELRKLSVGETGDTCLARNKQTGELVVKKQVSIEAGVIYERLRTISSPYLVPICEICFLEDSCIVVEKYISGETIKQKLEQRGRFSEGEAKDIAIQILRALQLIYKNGIVHRDLTASNILISTDGIVKVLDFGIARIPKENKMKDTILMGTVGYASPEQFGFCQTDDRTDIYAFGVLLNKMITGKMPNEQLVEKREFRAIIKKCIMIDPKERYFSAGEILKELGEKGVGENIWETDRSIWPGFRKNVAWRKFVAIVAYLYVLMGFTGVLIAVGDSLKNFCIGFFSMFLFWIVPLASLTNFLRWDSRLEILRIIPKGIRVIIRIIIALLFMYAGIVVLMENGLII